MNSDGVERRFAAILATDVVGYSAHMRKDEESTLARLKVGQDLIAEATAQHHGRVFGAAGDAVLAEFASPVEAVRAAVAIQQAIAAQNNAASEQHQMLFRIGINLGDVMVDGDNLYGDGVNVAARLEGLADPGGIAVAEHVRTYVRNKVDFDFEDLGSHKVKNIDEAVRVFKVLFSMPATTTPEPVIRFGNATATSIAPSAMPARSPDGENTEALRAAAEGYTDIPGLEITMRRAMKVIDRSPQLQGGARLPWFFFLGNEGAGVRELLNAAISDSPLPPPEPPQPGETVNWDWWFFAKQIAIRGAPGFVGGLAEQERMGAWLAALRLLKKQRPEMPVNGFVVCVSDRLLLGNEQERRDHSFHLRRLLESAGAELALSVPVYLLVTRLDNLPGFDAFIKSLPPGVENQGLGLLIDDPVSFGGSADDRAKAIRPMFERMKSLRHGILRREARATSRRGVFDFGQDFARLEDAINTVAGLLTERNALQHPIMLRGIFCVGGGNGAAFTKDFFNRFLVQDHGLLQHWNAKRSAG